MSITEFLDRADQPMSFNERSVLFDQLHSQKAEQKYDYAYQSPKAYDSKNSYWITYLFSRIVQVASNFIHATIGETILRSSSEARQFDADLKRRKLWTDFNLGSENTEYVVSSRSILVNDKLVDVMILGKRDFIKNRRWAIISNGNDTLMEDHPCSQYIDKLQTNFLYYNHPGVGRSRGPISHAALIEAHKGILNYAEIFAKEIIDWGVSLGGGIQGQAIENHEFKDHIRYVFVKDQTFSYISRVPSDFYGKIIRKSGWELSSVVSSRKLLHPEVIIQTAEGPEPKAEDIRHDNTISVIASLAYELLKDSVGLLNKTFVGIEAKHCCERSNDEENRIADSIMKGLAV